MSVFLFTCSLHYTANHNTETLFYPRFTFLIKRAINKVSMLCMVNSIVKGTCKQGTRHSGLAISEMKAY